MARTCGSSSRFYLLGLPAKLRLLIYEMLFQPMEVYDDVVVVLTQDIPIYIAVAIELHVAVPGIGRLMTCNLITTGDCANLLWRSQTPFPSQRMRA